MSLGTELHCVLGKDSLCHRLVVGCGRLSLSLGTELHCVLGKDSLCHRLVVGCGRLSLSLDNLARMPNAEGRV